MWHCTLKLSSQRAINLQPHCYRATIYDIKCSGEGGKRYRFSKSGMQVDGLGGTSIHLKESDLNPIKVIGYGASATVSKAFYAKINRFVALKVGDPVIRSRIFPDKVKAM